MADNLWVSARRSGTRYGNALTVGIIRDGCYNTDVPGGVPPGKYRIEIRAFDPSEPERVGPGAIPRRQLLPAKCNTRCELELTVKPGERGLEHDFDLIP